MTYFDIKKNLESSSEISFRNDEKKYLEKYNNKYYTNLFDNENFNLECVEKYLFLFFKKIEDAEFPLGHKYVNLDFSRKNKLNIKDDEVDFLTICENFYQKIVNYKNESKAEGEIENYVVSSISN